MAVNDFTGKNIKDTYPRLVQTDGTNLADGTGSILPLTFEGNNVKISGSLIANEYVVSSSVTNISIATLSGSTTFGDSIDDTHVFNGNINSNGKCEIPIRKLKGLIDENTTGNIRLEVIAEDTFFTPWESDFEVETSKKVTVEVKTQTTKKPIVETKVKVKVKKEKPTITEKQHVINLFKSLIKEDINVENISFKRNELNNIVATYLKENTVKNTGKVIDGVLKILEKEK